MARSSFGRQFLALLKRNFIIKKRAKRQTLQEILYPIYFVVILSLVKLGVPNNSLPAIEHFEEHSINVQSLYPDASKLLIVSPDTPQVDAIVKDALQILAGNGSMLVPEYALYNNTDEIYSQNESGIFMGIDFTSGTLQDLSYTIRTPVGRLPSVDINKKYGTQDRCRGQSGIDGCLANQYLYSGFVNLQSAIDTALMKFISGSDISKPDVQIQQFPKSEFFPNVSYLQVLAAIYLVMAYSPFINYMVVILVAEKEKHIKEGMRMMGMRDSAFWCSWALTYGIIIFFTTVISVLISFAARLLPNSNMFLFFLLLFFYGLTIISMSFLITPFFNKAQVAGGLASLASMIFSTLYLPVSLTRTYGPNGPESSIPVGGQFALALLPPVALALGVDQAVYLDINQGGMNFENITLGQFSVADSLIMLFVDFIIYGLLSVYFDNVIPGDYGQKRPPYFFLMPSYWCPPKTKYDPEVPVDNLEPNSRDDSLEEPVAEDMKGKNKIRMQNIRKVFINKNEDKKEVAAVNGITLDLYEGHITCLLGHNGAGKTTLINMLTGMTPITSGEASIYGYNVADTNEMNEIRGMTGVCPQHNILQDELTCEEHLEFFGTLKGVEKEDLDNEIKKALKNIDLLDQLQTVAKKLSGGQKRKLCVAIALIGNPKVIFLDEPTAGMDPYSRRHLWSLLKEQRRDKVILLTTHFMDEADILADRKAFISKGKMKCVGSSLFLKNRFGVGYHLSMVMNSAKIDDVKNLIQTNIPEAELSRTHGNENDFTLPLTSVQKFPDLFENLESTIAGGTKAEQLGIKSYGISMTTLEEVFLKIGIEEESDESDDKSDSISLNQKKPLLTGGNTTYGFGNEPKNRVSPEPEASPENIRFDEEHHSMQHVIPRYNCVNDKELMSQRFWALCKIRFLFLLRNKGILFFRIVPVIFIIVGAALQKVIPPPSRPSTEPLKLSASHYSYVTGLSVTEPNMTSKVVGTGGTNSTEFIYGITSQNIQLTSIDDNSNLLNMAPHHMGITAYDVSATGSVFDSVNVTAMYNDTAVHSLPSTMNVISNSLLSMISSSLQNITTYSKPWPDNNPTFTGWNNNLFSSIILLGLALSIIPPGFATTVVRDREIKARSQIRISGVTMNMYWSTTFFVDYVQYFMISALSIIILYAFQTLSLMYGGAALALILLYFFYMPVNMFLAYVLSFMFDKKETCMAVLVNIFMFASFVPFMGVAIMDMVGVSNAAEILHYVLTLIDPPYAAFGGLYYINKIYFVETVKQGTVNPDIAFVQYFEWNSKIPITLIAPLFHAVWLYFLMRLLEVKKTGGSTIDVFCGSGYGSSEIIPTDNPDAPMDEDEDVTEERELIRKYKENPQAYPDYKPVVMVENLRKEFSKGGGCCKRNKKESIKVAVRNNTFSVTPGDVFGLLGPNGAGKTTTLNMIIAQEGPSKGSVSVDGHDIRSSLSDAFQAMGYCPQHDALWEEITLQEHLECYSQLCGISKSDTKKLVEFFLESLQIKEHKDKHAKKLSGGTKRKLSYAMSMLGKATVVLMDEPSTGMDPKSKRFMWDTISAAFTGGSRGAILTTHYMEEADALCSRIAIMVNGQMECIGSTQHLKNKFGKGYILEVKVQQPESEEERERILKEVDDFIKREFENPELSECFGDRAIYSIPQDDVSSLAKVFASLEQEKEHLNIEEYSFSQSSLEQVFLEFAKLQVEENCEQNEELEKKKSLMKQQSVRSNQSTDL